jgi:hypothetical protein
MTLGRAGIATGSNVSDNRSSVPRVMADIPDARDAGLLSIATLDDVAANVKLEPATKMLAAPTSINSFSVNAAPILFIISV